MKSMQFAPTKKSDGMHTGETYATIMAYCIPELITAFLLTSLITLVDAAFIGHLRSTSLFAAQGIVNNFMHFLIKIAEGMCVGTIVVCGQFNGRYQLPAVGKALISSVWITVVLGVVLASFFFCASPFLFYWYGVSPKIAMYGITLLRLRSISIFFAFIYFALVGFFRAVKNTRLPMVLYIFGACIFIFFDYVLIFGKWGFPALGLRGSAIASIIQYMVMLVAAVSILAFDSEYKKYALHVWRSFEPGLSLTVLHYSWPIMIDKAVLAAAKIWLAWLLVPMGKMVMASFSIIKDIEMIAFVPAIASAQVITFLASNNIGADDWDSFLKNISRVMMCALCMVGCVLAIFCLFPHTVIQFFDKKGSFVEIAALALPFISLFVLFDVVQLILSGALRGASYVKTVMWTRLLVCFGIFVPLSYWISLLSIDNTVLKFVGIYSSFYISNGIMSIIYMVQLKRYSASHTQMPTRRKGTHESDYQPGITKTRSDFPDHRP